MAFPFVSVTAGNDFDTETVLLTPLTEIVAFVGFPGTNWVGLARPTEGATPGAAVFVFAVPFDDVAHELPAGDVASEPHAVSICCLNGSLLLNRLNEINWPALGGGGLVGSETPSAVVDVAGGDAPLRPPAEPAGGGGGTGWV